MASAVEDPTNNGCQSDDEGEIDGKFEEYMSKVDIIKCPGCLYESSAEEVRTHMKQTHFQQKYCNICEKEFSEWRGAHCLKHLLIAIISQLKEQCSNCSQLFMLDTKRSEEDNFTCKSCQKLSGTKEPVENSPHPHRCDICHKTFTFRKALIEHRRSVHVGNDLYRCDYCPRVFYYQKTLSAHRRIHINPISCEICFSEFHSHYKLKRHMSSHADAPQYNCSSCGKIFYSLAFLDSHKPCRSQVADTSDDL